MFAIILDEKNYIKSYSSKFKTPGSILVETMPAESDPEKLGCYQYIKKKFVFDAEKWAAIEAARAEAEAARAENERIGGIYEEIAALKHEIESSDYKIIKCYEYALNNLASPYDITKLHEERQALRDQINELEESLKDEEGV